MVLGAKAVNLSARRLSMVGMVTDTSRSISRIAGVICFLVTSCGASDSSTTSRSTNGAGLPMRIGV
jgi:hypothetical protein